MVMRPGRGHLNSNGDPFYVIGYITALSSGASPGTVLKSLTLQVTLPIMSWVSYHLAATPNLVPVPRAGRPGPAAR